MTPIDVLKKYKSQYNFQKETGITHVTLGNWIKKGVIPKNSQYRLEVITNGELKTDWSCGDDIKS